jgi:hypothetical protein
VNNYLPLEKFVNFHKIYIFRRGLSNIGFRKKPITNAQGERFIGPSTEKIYVVTALVFDGSYVILREANGDHQILMTQKDLRAWKSPGETG